MLSDFEMAQFQLIITAEWYFKILLIKLDIQKLLQNLNAYCTANFTGRLGVHISETIREFEMIASKRMNVK